MPRQMLITAPSTSSTVVVLGQAYAGKTSLINQLLFNPVADEEYISTEEIASSITRHNGVKLTFWELPIRLGQTATHKAARKLYCSKADIAVYCVDLSQQLDKEQILSDIQAFTKVNPGAAVLLVGTKADSEYARAINEVLFNQLTVSGVVARITTSAKEDPGLNQLKHLLAHLSLSALTEKRYTIGVVWKNAVYQFLLGTKDLPAHIREALRNELDQLTRIVHKPLSPIIAEEEEPIEPINAISRFTNNCQTILGGKNAHIRDVVFNMSTMATIIFFTTMVVSVGLCVGPTALVAGVMANQTVAGSVAVTGGLITYRFFKGGKECPPLDNPINIFVDRAQQEEPGSETQMVI